MSLLVFPSVWQSSCASYCASAGSHPFCSVSVACVDLQMSSTTTTEGGGESTKYKYKYD
ncbi:hypothetical protein PR003_g9256 [Phytophthora rubi]|uniref:Uncharacterized protein n=1 Tax=Phytophthora rubi TaxID=129364 RepID=A0A6A3MY89_9STRA|nr:hypothetical protein PR002_g7402 [Phytophthora rubi]KAE9036740.1 hypothetical protein PR001_g8690 [Phytophthora rubi]KAE9342866.1 hypothetical protein PR003_g9256 [Phytophthora rubi]